MSKPSDYFGEEYPSHWTFSEVEAVGALEDRLERAEAKLARYKAEVERLTATLSAPATAHEPGYKAGWNRGAKFALARVTAFIAKLEGE